MGTYQQWQHFPDKWGQWLAGKIRPFHGFYEMKMILCWIKRGHWIRNFRGLGAKELKIHTLLANLYSIIVPIQQTVSVTSFLLFKQRHFRDHCGSRGWSQSSPSNYDWPTIIQVILDERTSLEFLPILVLSFRHLLVTNEHCAVCLCQSCTILATSIPYHKYHPHLRNTTDWHHKHSLDYLIGGQALDPIIYLVLSHPLWTKTTHSLKKASHDWEIHIQQKCSVHMEMATRTMWRSIYLWQKYKHLEVLVHDETRHWAQLRPKQRS